MWLCKASPEAAVGKKPGLRGTLSRGMLLPVRATDKVSLGGAGTAMARLVLLSTAAAACLLAAGPALADEPPPLERPPNYAPPQALEMSDPLERFNRAMFSVDKKLMKWLGG